MDVKINIIEAAAELAETRVRQYYANKFQLKEHITSEERTLHEIVYMSDSDSTDIFRPEAQDLFNMEYDAIFEKLMDCKTIE